MLFVSWQQDEKPTALTKISRRVGFAYSVETGRKADTALNDIGNTANDDLLELGGAMKSRILVSLSLLIALTALTG